MVAIHFTSQLYSLGNTIILRLPKSESAKLPSRGMVMIKGTLNNFPIHTALEPDGQGSHWVKVDADMLRGAKTKVGDSVEVVMDSSKQWPEPTIPADIKKGLAEDTKAHALWNAVTPMARWDWIRWIGSTKNPDTRAHHIEVAFSKLKHGEKRPCCFNRSMCTDPFVSKNGILLAPITS